MDPKEVRRILEERDERISAELAAQFDNLFHVLSITIKHLSHKQWSSGETAARIPAQLACHIVESCESYATGEFNCCIRRFGVDAGSIFPMDDRIDPGQLPAPRDVVAYIAEVQQLVHNWLGKLSNADLLGPTPSPGWAQRGVTYLGRVIYILRHGTYHLGMLRAELDSRGVKYGGVFK